MSYLTDHDLAALAERFGTPLYVFDERALDARIRHLRHALPERLGLCYAIKANPFILPEVIDRVDRLEVCSPGEYRICRATGMPNEKIVVSGVCKDRETVVSALSAPHLPAAVTIESPAQADLVMEVAREHGLTVPLLVRLTSGNQFGLDRTELMALVPRLLANPNAELLGIQYFSGTQKTSVRRLERELIKLMSLADELERTFGWMPPELEYGPGFPVSYFDADGAGAFDEDALFDAFSQIVEGMPYAGALMIELGRSIAASCGTYLTQVVDAKVNAGQRYALVDGGIHHIAYYGQSMAMKQPPCHLVDGTAAPDGASEQWALCGSLCTINDLLAKQMDFEGLQVGSVLAFERAGAYCMTEGISLFLSRDLPAVVMVDRAGEPRLTRPHRTTDLLNTPLASLSHG